MNRQAARKGQRVRDPIFWCVALVSSVAMLLPLQLLNANAARAAGDTNFTVDLRSGAAPIPDVFSNMIFFQYKPIWNHKIETKPATHVNAPSPCRRSPYLHYATGGCSRAVPRICDITR